MPIFPQRSNFQIKLNSWPTKTIKVVLEIHPQNLDTKFWKKVTGGQKWKSAKIRHICSIFWNLCNYPALPSASQEPLICTVAGGHMSKYCFTCFSLGTGQGSKPYMANIGHQGDFECSTYLLWWVNGHCLPACVPLSQMKTLQFSNMMHDASFKFIYIYISWTVKMSWYGTNSMFNTDIMFCISSK